MPLTTTAAADKCVWTKKCISSLSVASNLQRWLVGFHVATNVLYQPGAGVGRRGWHGSADHRRHGLDRHLRDKHASHADQGPSDKGIWRPTASATSCSAISATWCIRSTSSVFRLGRFGRCTASTWWPRVCSCSGTCASISTTVPPPRGCDRLLSRSSTLSADPADLGKNDLNSSRLIRQSAEIGGRRPWSPAARKPGARIQRPGTPPNSAGGTCRASPRSDDDR